MWLWGRSRGSRLLVVLTFPPEVVDAKTSIPGPGTYSMLSVRQEGRRKPAARRYRCWVSAVFRSSRLCMRILNTYCTAIIGLLDQRMMSLRVLALGWLRVEGRPRGWDNGQVAASEFGQNVPRGRRYIEYLPRQIHPSRVRSALSVN